MLRIPSGAGAGSTSLLTQRRSRGVSPGRLDNLYRAIDNFVMRLRRHLGDDPRSANHLQTVRGAGYRLV